MSSRRLTPTVLHYWNLFLEPLVFLSSKRNFSVPPALTQCVDAHGGPIWNTQLAAATLTIIRGHYGRDKEPVACPGLTRATVLGSGGG